LAKEVDTCKFRLEVSSNIVPQGDSYVSSSTSEFGYRCRERNILDNSFLGLTELYQKLSSVTEMLGIVEKKKQFHEIRTNLKAANLSRKMATPSLVPTLD
jgi:hypothetical protein